MKKVSFLAITILLNVMILHAQNLPNDLPRELSQGYNYVKNFDKMIISNRHPSSFLLNARMLNDYFNIAGHTGDWYLHVYFASTSVNPTPATTFLVIVGTVVQGNSIVHDPLMTKVLVTTLAEPNCGTVFDKYIDVEDKSLNPGNPTGCNVGFFDITNQDDLTKLNACLANYQNAYKNPETNFPYSNSQSFLICVDNFRDYLATMPDYYPNDIPQYVQIYIGADPTDKTLNKDKLTIFLIGVDAAGRHVPGPGYTSSNGNYSIFNECNPCPLCNIAPDKIFGSQYQFLGTQYKAFDHLSKSRKAKIVPKKSGNKKKKAQ